MDCSFNMYNIYMQMTGILTDSSQMWVRSMQGVVCVPSFQSAYLLLKEDRSMVDDLHNPGKRNTVVLQFHRGTSCAYCYTKNIS